MDDPYISMGAYTRACRDELRKLGVSEDDIDAIEQAYTFGEGYEQYRDPAAEAKLLLAEFRI